MGVIRFADAVPFAPPAARRSICLTVVARVSVKTTDQGFISKGTNKYMKRLDVSRIDQQPTQATRRAKLLFKELISQAASTWFVSQAIRMKLPDHPALRLRIKPSFSSSNEATHLSLTFSLQQPQTGPHRVLFTFSTFNDNVPSHPYKENDIHAEDAAGRLHLNFFSPNDKSGGQEEFLQEWRVHRDVVGDVTLKMDVYPRKVNINTPLGARVDLRTDQGGLQGAGRWFLPRLLAEDSTRLYTNIVEWDLCSAPPRTRAIWSHGEGPQAVIKVGTTSTLVDTVYMVGPIQSYPPKAMPGSVPGFCGSYWFGRLPKNLDRLKDFNSAIFKPMAEMFKDEGSSYRIFIRSAVLGYGGTGFDASYVLEYDGRTAMNSDQDIQALFAHEMVHSFIQMPPEKDDSDDNGWFVEGELCPLRNRYESSSS